MSDVRSSASVPVPLSPTLSATSSSASTTATVLDTHTGPKSLVNLRKQLKYLIIGGVLTSYFQVYSHLADALSLGVSSSSAKLALLSVVLLVATVVLFGYVILLPARGQTVNYIEWRSDSRLSTSIPLLTASIILGWITLLVTLSPVGAPAPPSRSIRERLQQAAKFTGLDSQARINDLPARVLGESWDKIAANLGLTKSSSTRLGEYFAAMGQRAEEWARHNMRTVGWTGAIAGSVGTYLVVFGAIGLLGFLAPQPSTKPKRF